MGHAPPASGGTPLKKPCKTNPEKHIKTTSLPRIFARQQHHGCVLVRVVMGDVSHSCDDASPARRCGVCPVRPCKRPKTHAPRGDDTLRGSAGASITRGPEADRCVISTHPATADTGVMCLEVGNGVKHHTTVHRRGAVPLATTPSSTGATDQA